MIFRRRKDFGGAYRPNRAVGLQASEGDKSCSLCCLFIPRKHSSFSFLAVDMLLKSILDVFAESV